MRIQDVKWPGVFGVEAFEYTCLHGTSPGVFRITTSPQDAAPQEFGTLQWTDGITLLRLTGARLFKLDGTYISGQGTSWELFGHDERWMWRNKFSSFGNVSGHFNQRDDRGELVPYTVMSPEELAILCLQKMGVVNYRLRLPPGLSSSQVGSLQRRLFLGERFPPTNTNPEFIFDHTPAAEALEQICEKFSCRVIYQPFGGLVLIAPPGQGRFLPPAPMEMMAPSIDNPEPPAYIAVYGSPIRFQARFLLEPVGEEWHGYPLPIDDLSYAPPKRPTKPGIATVTYNPATNPTATSVKVTVSWTDASGNPKTAVGWDSDPSHTTIAARWAGVIASLSQSADLNNLATVTSAGNVLTITGKVNLPFTVTAVSYLGEANFPYTAKTTQPGESSLSGWESCPPPTFGTVQPTDRLSYFEALSKARGSVWRWWRIVLQNPGYKPPPDPTPTVPPTSPPPATNFVSSLYGRDVIPFNQIGQISKKKKTPKPPKGQRKQPGASKPLRVPFYSDIFGPVQRRQQVILQESKVEQITPKPRIAGGVVKGTGVPLDVASGILAESYTGRSLSQVGVVRGAVWKGIGAVRWVNRTNTPLGAVVGPIAAIADQTYQMQGNTEPTDRVWVNFRIVNHPSGDQLVVFDEPVYAMDFQGQDYSFVRRPRLVLETGCMMLHPDNNQVIRWEDVYEFPGGVGGEEWHLHEDLQVGVVGGYDDSDNLKGWHYGEGDYEYVKPAARYYIDGHAMKYRLVEGAQIQYPRTMKIEPDSGIQQVTWRLSKEGPTTVVGVNNEFHPTIPDAPARRRNELLSPDRLAAAANARERAWVNEHLPKGGGSVK
jgi:hypothetical protein